MKYRKLSQAYAGFEFFVVKDSALTPLYNSPVFGSYRMNEGEVCIPKQGNDQYKLVLGNRDTEPWQGNSWLEIRGIYDNIVYKGFKITNTAEQAPVSLSLYTPILKGVEWKRSSVASSGWNTKAYDDSEWSSYFTGSTVDNMMGTQYLRKSFIGLSSTAAYELQIAYLFGIVVYINGVEVYRDNLPSSTIEATTVATSSYNTIEYHGIIRPSSVIQTMSVIAIEYHPLSLSESYLLTINAWLAQYGQSLISGDNCYSLPIVPTLSASGSNPEKSFDYDRNSAWINRSTDKDLVYAFNTTKVAINGALYYPNSGYAYKGIKSFIFEGSMTGESYTSIFEGTNLVYSGATFLIFKSPSINTLYKNYKLRITEQKLALELYVVEFIPIICSPDIVPIEYPQNEYTFYSAIETIQLVPTTQGLQGCTVYPSLPAGLSMDSACVISGVATETSPMTQYVVETTSGLSGIVCIQIITCLGTALRIQRVYKTDSRYETYTIVDSTSQEVIRSEDVSTSQVDNTQYSGLFCVSAASITVRVGLSSGTEWAVDSMLFLYIIGKYDEEMIYRYRYNSHYPITHTIPLQPIVAFGGQWRYKFDSIPDQWYNTAVTGWEESSSGLFPLATSQIQLFKKVFSVASLSAYSAISIRVRYMHGAIVYLNGFEVYRNHFSGALSSSSFASSSYDVLEPRGFSFPILSMDSVSPPIQYLIPGENVIAIALIAREASEISVDFDCSLRFLDASSLRLVDYSVTSTGLQDNPNKLFDFSSSTIFIQQSCGNNEVTLTFNKDRREWISSISILNSMILYTPRSLTVLARNGNDEWVSLRVFTSLKWTLGYTRQVYWITNSNAYNQYRFQNIAGDNSCIWRITSMDISCNSMSITVPALTYPNTELYKNVEMTPLSPNAEFYYDFSVNPSLPTGLLLDVNTGAITGKTASYSSTQPYTISAKRFSGRTVTSVLSLGVVPCVNGKGYISIVVNTGTLSGCGFALFSGRSVATTNLLFREYPFTAVNTETIYNFCLTNAIYTVQLYSTTSVGWAAPGSLRVMYEDTTMKHLLLMLPSSTSGTSEKQAVFSSYHPFQKDITQWKVEKASVPSTWTQPSFSDSTWSSSLASAIGSNTRITTYIRTVFSIPSITEYVVLNIRMLYRGGAAVYFNGRMVARFNLDKEFGSNSTATSTHDPTQFSYFHVILLDNGATAWGNVLAIELHEASQQTTPVVFDATGVFGVDTCSIVLDTMSYVASSSLSAGVASNLFDHTTQTSVVMSFPGSFEWKAENLEGMRFNAYGFYSSGTINSFGFTLAGDDGDGWYTIQQMNSLMHHDRYMEVYSAEVAMNTNYHKRMKVTAGVSSATLYSMYFLYCTSDSSICSRSGDYPAVYSNQLSPGPCNAGFYGYSYRRCTNGVFGSIQTDHCDYKAPTDLSYPIHNATYVRDIAIESLQPSYTNLITEFSVVNDTLPNGLLLDRQTGMISGTPIVSSSKKDYTIQGANPSGGTTFVLSLEIRVGRCLADERFAGVNVDMTSLYQCSNQGFYFGTLARGCHLGEKDGEWSEVTGTCKSLWLIVGPIIGIVIIVIIVVVIKRNKRPHLKVTKSAV